MRLCKIYAKILKMRFTESQRQSLEEAFPFLCQIYDPAVDTPRFVFAISQARKLRAEFKLKKFDLFDLFEELLQKVNSAQRTWIAKLFCDIMEADFSCLADAPLVEEDLTHFALYVKILYKIFGEALPQNEEGAFAHVEHLQRCVQTLTDKWGSSFLY